jgi:hypothetical protein
MSNEKKYAIWSPHRDATSVLVFRSLLSLRNEPWHWVEAPENANWWVLDAERSDASEWFQRLADEQSKRKVASIALAKSSASLPEQWNFFKLPLKHSLVQQWVQSCLNPELPAQQAQKEFSDGMNLAPDTSDITGVIGEETKGKDRFANPSTKVGFEMKKLHLKQWPDMARYSDEGDVADGVQLTLACLQMMNGWIPYEDISKEVHGKLLLDLMLKEALEENNLELEECAPEDAQTVQEKKVPEKSEGKPHQQGWGWGLITQLKKHWGGK